MIDFLGISYLAKGSAVQQLAYNDITANNIMTILRPYTPVLAGTIPIDIAIQTSDLDILCCYTSADAFHKYLEQNFGRHQNFKINKSCVNDEQSVIANFDTDSFNYEIFGQAVPVTSQNGYRHMIAEYKILLEKGESFRKEVIALKQSGCKTEPAFAKLLGLSGDPYKELLLY